MKIQRQITSILSTMLIAGMFLTLPLRAQQSNSQPPAQQSPETAQQPQQQNPPSTAQPAQTTPAPAPAEPNTQAEPGNTQPAAPAGQTPPNQTQQNQPQQAQPQQNQPGTSVNPSQAPLAPVTTYPDASGTQQQQPNATTPAQTSVPEGPQPRKQTSEPVGAATAESVPTAGGAAAKPAGVAIAPAKQHQTRSWLIKLGAVVAAGAAVGTVYALSRGTSSTPPGATGSGVVQK